VSGFAADWLALREAADLRARNGDVLLAATTAFNCHTAVTIVDLGCGTGANLRALAMHLPVVQHWRLVDDDPMLLAAGRAALRHWADRSQERAEQLILDKSGKHIDIDFVRADLAKNFVDALAGPADLVTAAAFFDLASRQWIAAFCRAMARRALPLYAVLTYDGCERWSPPHPADAAIRAAFHAHQGRDKGFGPAAGPAAAAVLQAALRSEGYDIVSGSSPWHLGAADRALIAALANGAAAAVAETTLVPAADCVSWRAARVAASACTIGHVDLFARPSRPDPPGILCVA
jgi:SAM-dependent methyltransferase